MASLALVGTLVLGGGGVASLAPVGTLVLGGGGVASLAYVGALIVEGGGVASLPYTAPSGPRSSSVGGAVDGRGALFLGINKQFTCSCRHICSVSVPAAKARCIIILTLGELALSSMQRSRILLGHVRQLGPTGQSSR